MLRQALKAFVILVSIGVPIAVGFQLLIDLTILKPLGVPILLRFAVALVIGITGGVALLVWAARKTNLLNWRRK